MFMSERKERDILLSHGFFESALQERGLDPEPVASGIGSVSRRVCFVFSRTGQKRVCCPIPDSCSTP